MRMLDIMRITITRFVLLAAIVSLVSCRADDDQILIGRPEQRLNDTMTEYHEKLTSSTYGWKAFLYPSIGHGYTFYMTFSSEGRVSMIADYNVMTAKNPMESSYDVQRFQAPSLVFNTYNYLHWLTDPETSVFNGLPGHGLFSDFEFSFQRLSGDTIFLTGNQHGSDLILIKATKKEGEEYAAGRLSTIRREIDTYLTKTPYLFLLADDNVKTSVAVNISNRVFSLVAPNGEDLNIQSTSFSFSTKGLTLSSPLYFGDEQIEEIVMDTASEIMYFRNAADTRIDIKVLEGPVFPMHKMIGVDFFSITVPPDPAGTPGWSADFKYYWLAIDKYLVDNYDLRLSDIQLTFNPEKKWMDVNIYIRDVNANKSYRLRYPYVYKKTDDVLTFHESTVEQPNYNAVVFKSLMSNILSRIAGHNYTMNYLPTADGFYGQMKNMDDDRFYLAGKLR